MKNHIKADGMIIQTNKRFDDLKDTQKNKINEWLYEEYRSHRNENYGEQLTKSSDYEILLTVKEKIEDASIWLPRTELFKYYSAHKNRFEKRYLKENKA